MVVHLEKWEILHFISIQFIKNRNISPLSIIIKEYNSCTSIRENNYDIKFTFFKNSSGIDVEEIYIK